MPHGQLFLFLLQEMDPQHDHKMPEPAIVRWEKYRIPFADASCSQYNLLVFLHLQVPYTEEKLLPAFPSFFRQLM